MQIRPEDIQSKKYFADAKLWYEIHFISPTTHRTILIFISAILIFCALSMCLMIYNQFPLEFKEKYIINGGSDIFNNQVSISTDSKNTHPILFIAEILCKDYVIKRESYNYTKLKEQLTYLQKLSTKRLFKTFYDSIDTGNPESPLLKYQRYGVRNIEIQKTQILDSNNIRVDFAAYSKDREDKIFLTENFIATISFESDQLSLTQEDLHFLVTEYKVIKKL